MRATDEGKSGQQRVGDTVVDANCVSQKSAQARANDLHSPVQTHTSAGCSR